MQLKKWGKKYKRITLVNKNYFSIEKWWSFGKIKVKSLNEDWKNVKDNEK